MLLCAVTVSCYSGLNGGTSGANGDGADDDGGGDGGRTPGMPAECETQSIFDPGRGPLRRLTVTQYNNTVRDLFADADIPWQTIVVDPKMHGFENFAEQQAPSSLLIGQYQAAAVAVTAAAWNDVQGRLGCDDGGGDDPGACGQEFLEDFGRRAFRRPMTNEESEDFIGFFDAQLGEHNFRVALELTMQAMLQSPAFVYFFELDGVPVEGRDDIERLGGYAMASRLSYLLWDTMPDEELFDAAESGQLDTKEGVEEHAWRMLEDPRARDAVVNFHRQWLTFDKIDRLDLDPATYPQWESALRDSLLEGLARTIEHTVFDGEGTLAALLGSSQAMVDDRLAGIYGVQPPGDWTAVELDPDQRAGILTNSGWLAGNSHAVNPSPVQRGVFVLERLLCAPPPAPPANVDTNPPEGGDGQAQTNRERYAEHSSNPTCAGCHTMIDGIGFGFEHYDSLGVWRDEDGGQPVDATGQVVSGSDVDGPFDGAVELAHQLADSQTVRDCFATQWLRYALARNVEDEDACTEASLQNEFEESGGDIRALLVAIVRSDAFRHRRKDVQ